jgi:hypothetical protein
MRMRSCPQPSSATERKAVQFSLAKRWASPGDFFPVRFS